MIMSEVHYWTNRVKFAKYRVKYLTACGVIDGYLSPRFGYKNVCESTQDSEEVTCKNCKRTKIYEQSKE